MIQENKPGGPEKAGREKEKESDHGRTKERGKRIPPLVWDPGHTALFKKISDQDLPDDLFGDPKQCHRLHLSAL